MWCPGPPCAARPKAQYLLAVAGDECGEVDFYFDDRDLFGGVASKIQIPGGFPHKVMRQVTIDDEIGTRALITNIPREIAKGEFGTLHGWLREHL